MNEISFPPLNLPPVNFRFSEDGQSKQIFDLVRKRFVALTPEEWVRQHFLHFMINEKSYPASLMGVEMLVRVNELAQRADIVIYQNTGKPWMIVECKKTEVPLTQETFYQLARYNLTLQVPYMVITNGLEHYCMFFNGKDFEYLDDLPAYNL